MSENSEIATSEIVEEITEAAEEIIEEHEERQEVAEEINRALLDSIMLGMENRLRDEFEERVMERVAEISEGLFSCRNELERLSSEMMRLSQTAASAEATAETAEAMAETSLTLQVSNLQSEGADGQENQMEMNLPVNPEIQESPSEPPAPLLRKLKRRLL